jgi:hypothetical protein
MTYVADTLSALIACMVDEARRQQLGQAAAPASEEAVATKSALESAQVGAMYTLFQFTHKVERSLEQIVQCILSMRCAALFAADEARALNSLYLHTAALVTEGEGAEKAALLDGYLCRIVGDYEKAMWQHQEWLRVCFASVLPSMCTLVLTTHARNGCTEQYRNAFVVTHARVQVAQSFEDDALADLRSIAGRAPHNLYLRGMVAACARVGDRLARHVGVADALPTTASVGVNEADASPRDAGPSGDVPPVVF